MKHLDLIYLDVAFITRLYEEAEGRPVPIRTVVTSDQSSGASLHLGVIGASVGVSMKEQKEYPLDSRAMFGRLQTRLAQYSEVDLNETKDGQLPEVFWLEGHFGLGSSGRIEGAESVGADHHYQFVPTVNPRERHLNLVAADAYFALGYDQLSRYGKSMAIKFAIPARLLVRLLFLDEYYPVAAPLVIIKKGNS